MGSSKIDNGGIGGNRMTRAATRAQKEDLRGLQVEGNTKASSPTPLGQFGKLPMKLRGMIFELVVVK